MSNYIGYSAEHNERRKKNNMEDSGVHELPKTMNRIKKWGGTGINKLDRDVAELKRRTKESPVHVYTQEEIDELMEDRDER